MRRFNLYSRVTFITKWATLQVLPAFLISLCSLTALAGPQVSLPSINSQTSQKPNSSANQSQPNADLGAKLQAYMMQSKKKLGELPPWQSKLFDQEALPEYQRFIRGYRAVQGGLGVEADVDFESLKKYLRFYAPKSLKRENPSLVVVLSPAADCSKCSASLPEIRKLVGDRITHRGFVPIWVERSEIPGSDSSLDAGALKLAESKKAAGSLVVSWGLAPSEEDETRYQIRSNLQVRDFAKHDGSLELLEAGSFEHSASKLLTDAFTDLGDKSETAENAQSSAENKETLLEMKGTWSYAEYVALKNMFQNALQDLGAVDERRVGRGHAVLAVHTDLPATQVADKLKGLETGGMFASVSNVDIGIVRLEVHPSGKASGKSAEKLDGGADR